MSIKIEDLTYIYSKETPYEKKALDKVNLEIQQGEFVGLIGHTGSGKSTLIQHLNALLSPDSGRVIIDGVDVFAKDTLKKDIRRKVGLVFQYPEHQLFEINIYKDVAFGPINMGVEKEHIDQRVRSALSKVGIGEEMYDISPFELSGGQKRRVAIAGVIAMEPDILVLDEPTAGLDPQGRDEILHEIQRLHETLGITIILVSHSMEDVARFVNRIVVMDRGNILLDGDKYKVFSEVETLEKIGLGVPQVTKLTMLLKKQGFVFDSTITTLEEATQSLKKQLQVGKIND
jgi:energy-coupling factor transport system ATP-binding protein